MKQQRTSTIFATLAVIAALCAAAAAQNAGGGQKAEILQKLKSSSAENKQKLQQYTWLETQQATLKGEAKPAQSFECQYGPDGRVEKTPLGAPPAAPEKKGGKFKQKIVAKKTAEMKDYMGDVKGLLALYVPPNPQRMQQAFQQGKVSINSTLGSNQAQLVFKDYAQPGDQMTVAFDSATKKIQSLNVNTYLNDAKDAVTLAVQFASLPDGTNYAQQTVLDAKAKQMQVTTTNSNYAKKVQ
jgi:hypothetical protein